MQGKNALKARESFENDNLYIINPFCASRINLLQLAVLLVFQ